MAYLSFMTRFTFRLVVLLGTISVTGIIIIQIYWVKNAFSLSEKQFNQTINIALRNVAEKLAAYNKASLPNENPVSQLATDYYVVNVNTIIDANVLEYYLRTEFNAMNITNDYEYAIYDCSSNQMMYGNYIGGKDHERIRPARKNLPKYDKYTYYFGIYFPGKNTLLASKMDIWIFSSLVLLIVILFFGYALATILKQYRLSEVQRDFVNNMTHEFKTPLSTIAISAEVLSQPGIASSPATLSTYTEIIRNENSRLVRQVERVLQMAHTDHKKVHLNLETVDLHELIQQSMEQLRMNSKEKSIAFVLQLEAPCSLIKADKIHLGNVLYNLLDNAIKYSGDEVRIQIQTSVRKKGLELSISDNGIGMNKEQMKRIFDKFYRVPTGNIHNVKGFGLGLHYVKNIVSGHGWKIKVESTAGRGSCFRILFPKTEKCDHAE
jgi:two-component system phosphate regulon sensor histidine kinase PhoR